MWEELEDRLLKVLDLPNRIRRLKRERARASSDYYKTHSLPPARPLNPYVPRQTMNPEAITICIMMKEWHLTKRIQGLKWYYRQFRAMLLEEQDMTPYQLKRLIRDQQAPYKLYEALEEILSAIDEAVDWYHGVEVPKEKQEIDTLDTEIKALFEELEG